LSSVKRLMFRENTTLGILQHLFGREVRLESRFKCFGCYKTECHYLNQFQSQYMLAWLWMSILGGLEFNLCYNTKTPKTLKNGPKFKLCCPVVHTTQLARRGTNSKCCMDDQVWLNYCENGASTLLYMSKMEFAQHVHIEE
jgi:hypothetical protein